MKFNAIGGVGLLGCSSVKIGKLVFVRALLAEDPKRLAGDSIVFSRDAVSVRKTNIVAAAGSVADKVAPELALARSS